MIDSIDSEKDKAGDEFRASLEDPIKVGDAVVAPKGSDARVRLVEDKQSGKFTGRAELTIQLLSFSVNGKKWINVFPTDGLFDSKTETFRFKTDSLKPGTYVVVLRIRDAAGNTGSGDAVFTVQQRDAGR